MNEPVGATRRQWSVRVVLLAAAGFCACGLHVAFLGTKLPGVIATCGLPVQ